MGRSPKDTLRALLIVAEQQQGLFTARQAGEAATQTRSASTR